MAITLICECGRRLDFKDEYAGRQVRCPDCDKVNTVGDADAIAAAVTRAAAPLAAAPVGDPTFAREKFLLKQKAMTLNEKYDVADEQGRSILFIERPTYVIRGILALIAGLIAAFVVFTIFSMLMPAPGVADTLAAVLALSSLVASFATLGAVSIALSPKRHVSFYKDERSREKVLHIEQDKKWQPITSTFTVKDEAGNVIARLRKNYLYNIFRRRWVCLSPSGSTLMMAKEDSVILSLLRRLLGTFFGLLRAQFIITRGDSDVVLGEFNRKFTLLDRYVLDMSRDSRRLIDRRLALAVGVMLDTGERR